MEQKSRITPGLTTVIAKSNLFPKVWLKLNRPFFHSVHLGEPQSDLMFWALEPQLKFFKTAKSDLFSFCTNLSQPDTFLEIRAQHNFHYLRSRWHIRSKTGNLTDKLNRSHGETLEPSGCGSSLQFLNTIFPLQDLFWVRKRSPKSHSMTKLRNTKILLSES